MNQLYPTSLKNTEKYVKNFLTIIVRDPKSPYFGKPRLANGLYEPGCSFGLIERVAEVYCWPESIYYKSEDILQFLHLLCVGAEDAIHEDGTDDLIVSNFHQPEHFNFPAIYHAYRFLTEIPNPTEKERIITEEVYHLVERLAEGLLSSGFHTPNHRWVHTAALFYAYNALKTKDERFLALAEKYLAEKIDIDAYGEFSERSAGMYSAISDRALCEIAVEAGKPELFELVKRNLLLVSRYIERESLIFTQNSRRKDKGEVGSDTLFDFERYIDICLIAYANTHDLTFLQIVKNAMDNRSEEKPIFVPLRIYMRYPELKKLDLDSLELPEMEKEFHAFYPDSHIVRAKTKDAVYSILAQNPDFLHITVGDIRISARMCSSFFAIAQFLPDEIEQTGEKKYRMSFHTAADYKLPFDVPPQGSEKYWTMDYKSRKSISRCEYGYTVDFEFTEKGLRMHLETDGMPNVPFKLEFAVTPNAYVRAGNALTMATPDNFICAADGDIALCNHAGDRITIKGAFAEHFYHKDMRGSLPSPNHKFMLYFTGFSPINKTVEIICEKDQPWDFFEA